MPILLEPERASLAAGEAGVAQQLLLGVQVGLAPHGGRGLHHSHHAVTHRPHCSVVTSLSLQMLTVYSGDYLLLTARFTWH